ncbi:MAG: FtsX-like permease family protein [Planctomycetes bacterium]|nr:FtsX-like permease family protein [Planctomycetota bacterium]
MTVPGFVIRNALRNRRRSFLTILSVGICLFLFCTLLTVLRELTSPPKAEGTALRLAVRHKVSLGNVLPGRYRARIESLPGVECSMPFTWFGGIYQDPKNFFPQFACDPQVLFKIFHELSVPPDQIAAFQREKTACVVGKWTVDRFGFKLGDRLLIQGDLWPVDLELTVRGIYTGGIEENNLFFHHEYLDDLLGHFGKVGTFWVKVDRPESAAPVIRAIDAMFRNSSAETKTETERAFQLSFVEMLGNVRLLIGSLCSAIGLTMVLVTAGTMNMAIRERLCEVAVLKALGFDGRQIFGLILAESFFLSFTGGLLGCFGAKLIFSQMDVLDATQGIVTRFEVTPHILLTGLLVAAALGLVTALPPTWTSLRMSVADGLRTLD